MSDFQKSVTITKDWEAGIYNLNCEEYKHNTNTDKVECCSGCHKNSCVLWPTRTLLDNDSMSQGFMVCCAIGKICFKRIGVI